MMLEQAVKRRQVLVAFISVFCWLALTILVASHANESQWLVTTIALIVYIFVVTAVVSWAMHVENYMRLPIYITLYLSVTLALIEYCRSDASSNVLADYWNMLTRGNWQAAFVLGLGWVALAWKTTQAFYLADEEERDFWKRIASPNAHYALGVFSQARMQRTFRKIVRSSYANEVRAEAAKHLRNRKLRAETFAEIYCVSDFDETEWVKQIKDQQLLTKVAWHAQSADVRLTAAQLLLDEAEQQKCYADMAQNLLCFQLRIAAVALLKDRELANACYREISGNPQAGITRIPAAQALQDEPLLQRVCYEVCATQPDADPETLSLLTDLEQIKTLAQTAINKSVRQAACAKTHGHSLDENCVCSICGGTFHDLSDQCVCARCGQTVHTWGPSTERECTVSVPIPEDQLVGDAYYYGPHDYDVEAIETTWHCLRCGATHTEKRIVD